MQNSRVYAGINLSAVLHNLDEMHKNINKDTKIVAVIKTDGYGHGALPIAKAIEENAIRKTFVKKKKEFSSTTVASRE